MREVAFIKQNKEKWLEVEQAIVENRPISSDEMSKLYVQLMADLSYAQTYYPKSKTVEYLNYLAKQLFQQVYKTRPYNKNRLLHFFMIEVPLLAHQYRKTIYLSFALFFAFVCMGVLSASYDEGLSRLILGDHYVNMTLENIKNGNPVAVYKSSDSFSSTVGITFNNLKVGLYCYLGGIFAGFGTFYILLQNSLMLGTFQYFFLQEGVFWESVRGIWLHGSMEIFAIVIEASAGFILAASFLFPKTYSRINSLKIGLKNSFKIVISTMPFTIAAGFIEGFVTRYSLEMPNFLNVIIILTTLGIIAFYYLIYPFVIAKRYVS